MLTELTRETNEGALTALTRQGEGAPLVIIHGAMADAYAWTAVVNALAAERPVLLPNRRGRNPSSPIGDAYSVDTEVEDLMDWLRTIPEPVDLAGHSYGGLIATEAIRRGAAVRSLVLYEPVARPFGATAVPKLKSAIDNGDLDAAVTIINIDVSGYSLRHVEALRETPEWPKLCELAVPVADELNAINNFAFCPGAYGKFEVPTTLIAGQLSRHRPPYGPSVELFKRALGLDDVIMLPGQDHLAHVTSPDQLAQAIESGLAR